MGHLRLLAKTVKYFIKFVVVFGILASFSEGSRMSVVANMPTDITVI